MHLDYSHAEQTIVHVYQGLISQIAYFRFFCLSSEKRYLTL
jgi:hypothetical protein